MVFNCPLCENEYLLYSKLCKKCEKVKRLGNIYSFEKIYNILDSCLVITDKHQEVKLERKVKELGNEKNNLKV